MERNGEKRRHMDVTYHPLQSVEKAPTLMSEVSTSTTNCFYESGWTRIGAKVKLSFSLKKAASAVGVNGICLEMEVNLVSGAATELQFLMNFLETLAIAHQAAVGPDGHGHISGKNENYLPCNLPWPRK